MNRMHIRSVVRGMTGRLEEETGKLIGNRKLQLRGIAKTVSAKAERIAGDAVETIKLVLRRH